MGVQQGKYPPTPKTVHVQIPGTCEIVMFCGERVKIAGGMNRADRPADSEAGPGLSGGAWQGAQVPAGESEGDGQSQAAGAAPPAGGPRGGRRPPASGAGQSQRADSLRRAAHGGACGSAEAWIAARRAPLQTPDLQTWMETSLCFYKSVLYDQFLQQKRGSHTGAPGRRRRPRALMNRAAATCCREGDASGPRTPARLGEPVLT